MIEYTMPSLGADMESGKLIEWKVKPGDLVKPGDVMAVVGTEKGDIEVEIFTDGVVGQLLVPEGTEVPVGARLAVLGGVSEVMPTIAPLPVPGVVTAPAVPRAPVVPPVVLPVGGNGHRLRISPLARKVAAELGVDLSTVQGTGENGAISRADIEAAARAKQAAPYVEVKPTAPPAAPVVTPAIAPKPEPPPAPEKPVAPEKPAAADFATAMRQAIARAMARANRDIPHYYLQQRIDMSKALRWLEAENQKRSIKDRILPVVLLIKAVAKGLTQVPALNAYYMDDRHQPQEGIHIGFAIALRQGGLITPAIHNADLKSSDELMEALRDLIMRTRAGRLRGSEMTDATITLTNLGDLGVETVYGVIYPPQVALVGFGKISDQPWVENGMIGIRPLLTATLAGDHRATDGRTGAQFLDILNQLLQEPEKLWE
jgi:pyruvate dehydrogenase E2 component (dihydrolipoamide acetyltransferase)